MTPPVRRDNAAGTALSGIIRGQPRSSAGAAGILESPPRPIVYRGGGCSTAPSRLKAACRMPDGAIDIRELLQRGYRYALSLSHDAARAEDLVQDGWLRLLAARSPLTSGTLVRAIYCRFVELYRRDRRVKFEPLVESPADGNGNGEDFDFRGDDAELDAALGRLLPEERAALYLAHVAEWSTDDIGALFEWPRGTVHSVLHRLRRRLREELSVRGSAT